MVTIREEEQWLLVEKYGDEKCEAFSADCERLKNGEPLAYVIGHVPFLDTTIFLDSHPLIPRPETEYWTEKVIEDLWARAPSARVLDLCAGSGCIGIAIAKALPETFVAFVEINPAHYSTIHRTIRKNVIDRERTKVIISDLFENVTDKYDVIVSNPPYIDPLLVDRIEDSVKRHEPEEALFGGRGGLEVIKRIIAAAPAHLNPGGRLYLEHEPEQAAAISLFAHQHGLAAVTDVDQYTIARFTALSRTDVKMVPQ